MWKNVKNVKEKLFKKSTLRKKRRETSQKDHLQQNPPLTTNTHENSVKKLGNTMTIYREGFTMLAVILRRTFSPLFIFFILIKIPKYKSGIEQKNRFVFKSLGGHRRVKIHKTAMRGCLDTRLLTEIANTRYLISTWRKTRTMKSQDRLEWVKPNENMARRPSEMLTFYSTSFKWFQKNFSGNSNEFHIYLKIIIDNHFYRLDIWNLNLIDRITSRKMRIERKLGVP